MTDFSIEKSIEGLVIGLDEVGRGPLAGPVVSCGCLFHSYEKLPENIKIKDSKKHTSKQRRKLFSLFQQLQKNKIMEFHLGFASVKEIDELNILEATKLSMKRVLDKFIKYNTSIIVDGNFSLNYKNIRKEEDFYFVHSYEFVSDAPENILASTKYGNEVVAAVEKDNIVGVQFHPEKSQNAGIQFIKNFLEWQL